MPWQPPKTNWTSADVVGPGDFNRIEGNTLHLSDRADWLTNWVNTLVAVRIVEMASNANGTYVRWENGLQVCFGAKQSQYISSAAPTGSTLGTRSIGRLYLVPVIIVLWQPLIALTLPSIVL